MSPANFNSSFAVMGRILLVASANKSQSIAQESSGGFQPFLEITGLQAANPDFAILARRVDKTVISDINSDMGKWLPGGIEEHQIPRGQP